MKGMSSGVLSMAVMLAAGAAAAQGVPSAPIDLAVTYDGLHINHITAQNLGPRYMWETCSHRYALFGKGLARYLECNKTPELIDSTKRLAQKIAITHPISCLKINKTFTIH
jgi:hypothetical protein